MESRCPSNVLASASSASADELGVNTIKTDNVSEGTSLAPSPCSSGATPSPQQSMECSSMVTPVSRLPQLKSKSNNKRRYRYTSVDSPTLTPTTPGPSLTSEAFSPLPLFSTRGHSPFSTRRLFRGCSPTFALPGPT